MLVFDFHLAVAALDEIGNQVHRPRPIQRDQRGDVLDGTDLEFAAQIAHPAGFQLENADGVGLVEQVVGLGVVQRQIVNRNFDPRDSCRTNSQVLRMTVRVFSPRKSIFSRPRSPTGPMAYWVTMAPSSSFFSGSRLTSGWSPMTTPAAWTEALRVRSSRTSAVSINSWVWSFVLVGLL